MDWIPCFWIGKWPEKKTETHPKKCQNNEHWAFVFTVYRHGSDHIVVLVSLDVTSTSTERLKLCFSTPYCRRPLSAMVQQKRSSSFTLGLVLTHLTSPTWNRSQFPEQLWVKVVQIIAFHFWKCFTLTSSPCRAPLCACFSSDNLNGCWW